MTAQKKPIETIYRQFGLKVESIRTAIGLSQQDLAKRIGLTRASISNIESGNQRILLADVDRFATGLGTTPKFLMRDIWL